MTNRINMAGLRYGSVTAICDVGQVKSGDRKWQFLCDCGSSFEASGYAVRSGKVRDCPACAKRRSASATTTHGMTETPEFEVWTGMHTRCYNPKNKAFADYGGRGIAICERWRESFAAFLADMGPRPSATHSIERNNVNGNYDPGNCRWATRVEQARNKRNNVKVVIDGIEKTLAEWCRVYRVRPATASLRHKNGVRGAALFRTTVREITHTGVTDTISGWSKRTGLKPTTISMRVFTYNWPVERALTQGASR